MDVVVFSCVENRPCIWLAFIATISSVAFSFTLLSYNTPLPCFSTSTSLPPLPHYLTTPTTLTTSLYLTTLLLHYFTTSVPLLPHYTLLPYYFTTLLPQYPYCLTTPTTPTISLPHHLTIPTTLTTSLYLPFFLLRPRRMPDRSRDSTYYESSMSPRLLPWPMDWIRETTECEVTPHAHSQYTH